MNDGETENLAEVGKKWFLEIAGNMKNNFPQPYFELNSCSSEQTHKQQIMFIFNYTMLKSNYNNYVLCTL